MSLWLCGAAAGNAEAQSRSGIPVTIVSTPAGASVYLDSVDSPLLGITPLDTRIARGPHTLILKLTNHEETRISIDVRRRRETFRAVLKALGSIEINAASDSARGATVLLDGSSMGQLGVAPIRQDNVAPGRHQIRIEREGYKPYEQWVEVSGGQMVRLPVMLERAAPVVTGGTLRALCSVPNATISVDGEAAGASPVVRENLTPGEHIVEASAPGYQTKRETVVIADGQQRVVSLELVSEPSANGRIIVESDVPGANVLIDNKPEGAAPLVLQPAPGPHAVIVRADGYRDFSMTCTTSPGQDCRVNATLRAEQVRVRVTVQDGVRNARLFVDGSDTGPVPFDGLIPAGSHKVEIRAQGYDTFMEQVLLRPSDVAAGEAIRLDRTLATEQTGPSETEIRDREKAKYGITTHSAMIMPKDSVALDVSLGWPYLAELRLGVGLAEFLQAGFAIRTFGRLTEFEGRAMASIRATEQLAFGLQAKLGGGIGPSQGYKAPVYEPVDMRPGNGQRQDAVPLSPSDASRPTSYSYPVNSFYSNVELLATLGFDQYGAVTFWFGVDMSSDEYAGHARNSYVFMDYGPSSAGNSDSHANASGNDAICLVKGEGTGRLDCGRQTMARLRFGGALELVFNREWNGWVLLEGILAQPNDSRRILGSIFGDVPDTRFYFRLGGTYKFQ